MSSMNSQLGSGGTFDPSAWEAERQADLCEFESSPVYTASSGTARTVR